LVVCIAAAITITSFYRSSPFSAVDRSVVDAAIVLLPALGALLSMGRLAHRRPAAIGVGIALLYAMTVVTAGIVNGPGVASIFGMIFPGAVAVVLVLIGSMVNAAEFRAIARWIIVLAIVQAIIAIAEVQLLAPWAQQLATLNGAYPYRPNLVIDGIARANSTMGHPILLGLICAVGAVLASNRDIVRPLPLRLTIVALLGWTVVLSGSRSSIAALGFAILLFFIHPASPSKRWLRVVMILAITPATIIYIQEAVTTARSVSLFSLTNRIDALPRLVETLERPFPHWLFGEGVRFSLETTADNQILSVSGSYGLLGLLCFGAAVIYGMTSRNPTAVAVIGALTFMALSFDTLTWAFSTFMFWFMVGLARSQNSGIGATSLASPEPAERGRSEGGSPARSATTSSGTAPPEPGLGLRAKWAHRS
jgi:hypothetical protein